jgi:hypothetical protein
LMGKKVVGQWLCLPEFGREDSGETMSLGDSRESGLGEWRGVVGEMGGAEASEDTEGEVEAADDEFCGEMHWAVRDAEVGDEPEGSGSKGGGDADDEGVELGLGEAVEKEVGDDQVVGVFEWEGEGVGVMGVEAGVDVWCGFFAVLAEELEHGGAGVDCVDFEMRVSFEELSKEAAVSIAQDEGSADLAVMRELREIVIAAVFEGFAESEIFEPAIGFGDEVEVGFSAIHRRRKGRRRIGVVRARSAAARRVVRGTEWRCLCRRRRMFAERAAAAGIVCGALWSKRARVTPDRATRMVRNERLGSARCVIACVGRSTR